MERTKRIAADLQKLLNISKALKKEVVWNSAFFTILALDKKDPQFEDKEEYLGFLTTEKNLLLELAEKGCRIKLIICPANPKHPPWEIESNIYRTKTLLNFLEKGEKKILDSIEWLFLK